MIWHFFPQTGIHGSDTPSIDAFARLRTSEPYTIFDSKQLYDKLPLLWDEEITDGGGTPTSVHSTTNAEVAMTVNSSGDIIARQTFMRFNYQSGKSQLILMTTALTATASVRARVGPFSGGTTATAGSGHNGIFFEADGETLYVGIRKNGTDTTVTQTS